jgi:hypothetical protein
MKKEPMLQMGSDKLLPRHVHEVFFTVTFPDRSEREKGFKPDRKGGLICYTDGSKTNKGTGDGVYCNGTRRERSFSLGRYTTVFQAEVYAIKACVKENLDRKFYILSDSQAAFKVLDKHQINSKLVWDCYQILMELANHNRVQLVGYRGMRVSLGMKQQINWLRLDLNIHS